MNPARPSRFPYRLAAASALFAACSLGSGSAAGALGGDAGSVEADGAALEAVLTSTVSAPGYTVVELRTAPGTVVREFLSPAGKVFAVAWSGPALPDLRQLLGGYFDAYTAALRARQSGVGPAAVREGDLVVQSAGQMRDFFGRAYLRALLPQGVTPDDIH